MSERRRRAKRAEKDEERIRNKFGSEAAHREPLRILARERHLRRRVEGCFTMKFKTNVAFLIGIIAFMLSELQGPKWRHVKGREPRPVAALSRV